MKKTQNKKNSIIARRSFFSKIFKNLVVPKGAVCSCVFDVVYYDKKPVMYKYDNDYEEIFENGDV